MSVENSDAVPTEIHVARCQIFGGPAAHFPSFHFSLFPFLFVSIAPCSHHRTRW